MEKFKEHVQKNYLPFPVHTQFVESGVKEASLVSETGKEERMRSAIAQIRSATVRPFNDKAKLQQSHKTNDKKSHQPKGSIRTNIILSGVEKQTHDATKNSITAQTRTLLNQDNQFSNQRKNNLVEKICNTSEKPQNQPQISLSVDYTSQLLGMERYFDVIKNIYHWSRES